MYLTIIIAPLFECNKTLGCSWWLLLLTDHSHVDSNFICNCVYQWGSCCDQATFPPPVTHWGSIEDGATRWPICYQLLLVQRSWWWWWWVSGVTPGHLPHLAQTHLVTTSWCQQPLVTKASEAGVEMLLNLLYSAKLHKSEEIIVLRTRAWSSISTTHC